MKESEDQKVPSPAIHHADAGSVWDVTQYGDIPLGVIVYIEL